MLAKINQTIQMLQYEAKLTKRSFLNVFFEALQFSLKTGLGPRYYVVSGMARKLKNKNEWKKHVSAKRYYKALEILNPLPYRKITQHKLCEKALYQLLKIPTGNFVGHYHSVVGLNSEGEILRTVDDLISLLKKYIHSKICIKPMEGWGGQGVMILKVIGDTGSLMLEHLVTGRIFEPKDIVDLFLEGRVSEFLIEQHVEQTTFYAKLNPESLNTVRVWALLTDTGPEVLGAYLRVGRVGSDVDNGSRGGMLFPISVSSGEILPGLIKDSPHRGDYTHHIDSGLPIAGKILPGWHEVCGFVCRVLPLLPNTRFCGFDVALTDTGPVLIESNVSPDKDGAAHAGIESYRIECAAKQLMAPS